MMTNAETTIEHVVTITAGDTHWWRSCTCGHAGMRWPGPLREHVQEELSKRPCPEDQTVVSLTTLQMSWGGLFDGRPADGYLVHLVRQVAAGGTPGPTLCGIDRFAEDGPGWSAGGGLTGPGIAHDPCPGCAAAAREQFPGLPIPGMVGGREMAEHLGVPHVR